MDAGPSDPRSFRCDKCPKTYNRRDYLERHALNHEKPTIRCDKCGRAFTRPDVLRKHLREACKGLTPLRSSGGSRIGSEPPRKRPRQGASTGSPNSGTAAASPDPPAARHDPAGGLDMTLAPALTFEDVASTPQPGVDRGWTLPARAESALGVRNPVALSSGWNGAAPLLDSVDDIMGWLFNSRADNDTLLYGATSFGEPEAGAGGNDASLSDLVGSAASIHAATPILPPPEASVSGLNTSPSRPVHFHPYNVRNEPLRQAHYLPNDSVPREWEMPEPKALFSEDMRRQILDIYDGELREEIAVVFTLQRMALFMELYFMHFAPLYPIIHRASLGYRTLSPDLLLTIICIGTAYAADRQSFELAARMSKKIRDRIFERVEEEPRLDIQSLQTILQINHFSRSYCSLKQHDVSQIFHSPSITLARLSGVFAPNYASTRWQALPDPMSRWLEWVAVEERTRLGWFAFMMDIENAALFRHYLLIHCYVVEIPFPAPDKAWSASTLPDWQTEFSSAVEMPSFRDALRDLAGRGTIAPNADVLVHWTLLHGLISVSWTLLWRDLGDLSMVGDSKITQWKGSLQRAFAVWIESVERHSVERDGPFGDTDAQVVQAGIVFAHLGTILLMTETENIRIFAGAASVAARPISPGEWFAASSYVGIWAKSQDATYAVHAAMKALLRIFTTADEALYRTTPSFVAWCMYISALTIWAYASAIEGQDSLVAPYIIPTRDEASAPVKVAIEPALARREALAYLNKHLQVDHPFAIAETPDKNKCAGVIAYAAHLAGTLRRGIMEESRVVLSGLLTEHL